LLLSLLLREEKEEEGPVVGATGEEAKKADDAMATATMFVATSRVGNNADHVFDTTPLGTQNVEEGGKRSDEITPPQTPPEPEEPCRTLPESGWGDFFKLRPGEWRCKFCRIVNPTGATDCLCCVPLDIVEECDDDDESLDDQLASMEVELNVVTKEGDSARKQLKEKDAKIKDLTSQNKELLENAK